MGKKGEQYVGEELPHKVNNLETSCCGPHISGWATFVSSAGIGKSLCIV